MASYSQKPLKGKLGLKPNMSSAFLHVPDGYEKLIDYPLSSALQKDLDFLQYFTQSHQQLTDDFTTLKMSIKPTGMLWISWPKSSCSFASTDLTENTVRAIGLSEGLVDVKVVAINEDWSGLKFVYPLKDRKG